MASTTRPASPSHHECAAPNPTQLNSTEPTHPTRYKIHEGITRLMNISFMVMVVTHLVACCWYQIAYLAVLEEVSEDDERNHHLVPISCESIGKYSPPDATEEGVS